MGFDINKINKLFESRVRLGVMSILMVNERIDFKSLKKMLGVTDGNLASHISALEKNNLIKITKQFIGKKPNTTYSATEAGRKSFGEHLTGLEALINGGK